jgi:hypothetical protein
MGGVSAEGNTDETHIGLLRGDGGRDRRGALRSVNNRRITG